MQIHPSAIISKNAKIGSGTIIGPNVIIEDQVEIGSDNHIMPGVFIGSGTTIGNRNQIHLNAVIGHIPQDLAYKNTPSFTKIGNENTIREFTTIHRGTKEGSATSIGDSNFFMAYSHIGHNCQVGNKNIFVNQASLAGYCVVEDQAFLSGMTAIHQFCRVGRLAMISGVSASNKDIPPFVICGGRPAIALGINVVGMRRAGFSAAVRQEIKKAFKLLYTSGLNTSQALQEIKSSLFSAEAQHLVNFVENSKRGIIDDKATETLSAKKLSDILDAGEISPV